MRLDDEAKRLRRQLRRLVRQAYRDRLRERYPLVFEPPKELSLYRRVRFAVGRARRRLGLKQYVDREPWPAGLKHVPDSQHAEPLLIWAVGADRDTLRRACQGIQTLEREGGFAAVLITDVAEFAFYSRLGWLVEYVPTLDRPAAGYAKRKLRHLAWRYRNAAALPLSAGLAENVAQARSLLAERKRL